MASLSGFFGVLAMVIAVIGLYGLMSYLVTRRRVEIGIRIALGADPQGVVRMVLAQSAVLVLAGIVVGIALAMMGSRWAQSLLYAVKPSRFIVWNVSPRSDSMARHAAPWCFWGWSIT